MKFFLTLMIIFSVNAFSAEPSFKECVVVNETKLRIDTQEVIPAGSVAIMRSGRNITLNDILTDKQIFFRFPDGTVSKSHQWMYNRLNPVENRPNKYLVTSYNEDIIVTIGSQYDEEGETTITFVGVRVGEYLKLLCK